MQIKTSATIALLTLSASMYSCKSDDIPAPDANEQYNREFIKQFGPFDPNHDWNMSTQVSITVSTPKSTEVKIYADVDNKTYLFGTFKGVSGTRTLSVDVPKGTNSLTVSACGIDIATAPGGSVNFNLSRSVYKGEISAKLCERTLWKAFEDDAITSYRTTLPEHDLNLGKVVDNFTISPRYNEFIIYPIFYQTSNNVTLGLYYRPDGTYDTSEFIKIPIYNHKTSLIDGDPDILTNQILQRSEAVEYVMIRPEDVSEQYSDFNKVDFTSLDFRLDYYEKNNGTEHDYLVYTIFPPGQWNPDNGPEGSYNFKFDKAANNYSDGDEGKYALAQRMDWKRPEGGCSYDTTTEHYYRSKGIHVTVPTDQQFGFYITESGGQTFFSEKQFNEFGGTDTSHFWQDFTGEKPSFADELVKQFIEEYEYSGTPHFGMYETTYIENGITRNRIVLGCEDWINGDYDLNDLIFFIDNVEAKELPPFITIDKSKDIPYEWIIACEDLGQTHDFDFNDVVFGVSSPVDDEDGNRTVDIRALAAGGTLPIYLLYNDNVIIPKGNSEGGEFHSWFKHASSSVVNAHSIRADGDVATITVSKDFSISCSTVAGDGNMGGFKVRVVNNGKTVSEVVSPNITKGESEAPQMICVTNDWCWPKEHVHISDAYPQFQEWCQNPTDTHWHKTVPTEGKTWTRYDIPTDDSSSGGGGSTQKFPLEQSAPTDLPWGDGKEIRYTISDELKKAIASATQIQINIGGGAWASCGISLNENATNTIGTANRTDHYITSIVLQDKEKLESLKNADCFYLSFYPKSGGTVKTSGITLNIKITEGSDATE